MIQINDMFRLRSTKSGPWNKATLWHLEEWKPGNTIEGRWERTTSRMAHDDMDRLLDRMNCPADAHATFRAAQ